MMNETKGEISGPTINVTPLIDVLLVLLIIFMVAAPLKPHRYLAQLPSEPLKNPEIKASVHTLVVSIEPDRTLKLNALSDMGTVDNLTPLNEKLISVFQERLRNRVYRADMQLRTDLPVEERIEKTVFIKAPRRMTYGEVTRVIDGLKGSGAAPIGLQLDGLN